MSAYVVDNETIDKIIAFIKVNIINNLVNAPCLKEFLHATTNKEINRACQNLGTKMYMLNVGSVRQRYDDADEAGMIGQAYVYTAINKTVTDIEIYKAIQCWLYQSCEGEAINSSLYIDFREILFQIANSIIRSLPEYSKAEWG